MDAQELELAENLTLTMTIINISASTTTCVLDKGKRNLRFTKMKNIVYMFKI